MECQISRHQDKIIFASIILLILSHINGAENDDLSTTKNALTTREWPWPWRPEIHEWIELLNGPYYNLSAEPPEIWEALYQAQRVQHDDSPVNISHPSVGWVVGMFMDFFKAEEMYYAEYAGTNKTMFLCYASAYKELSPEVLDTTSKKTWMSCGVYTPEPFFHITKARDLSFIYKISKPTIDIYIGLAIILFLGGIIGNGLIIASILCNKDMKTPTNYFLFSLAVDDLLICLVFPFVQVYLQYLQPVLKPTDQGCHAQAFGEGFLFYCSIFHLTTISFERFFAICFPMKVKTICTKRRAKILIPVLWVFGALVALPRFFTVWSAPQGTGDYKCALTQEYFFTKWGVIHLSYEFGVFLLSLILIIHNYARLSYTLISSMKQNARLMEGNQNEDSVRASEDYKRRLKVIKMLVAIVIIFAICWTPRVLWILAMADDDRKFGHMTWKDKNTITYILTMFSYVNSIANAPVYYLTSNQFNKAFKRILTCGRLGKEEKMTSMITQSSMAASTSFTEKPQVSTRTEGGAP